MIRRLSDVYESARINIPLRRFPGRDSVVRWTELDESVRSELEALRSKIMAVLAMDDLLLSNHQRVFTKFNRGLREGFFGASDHDRQHDAPSWMSVGPFEWGRSLGQRPKQGVPWDPQVIKQFITATHLLAYEFGQLDEASASPYEFILRTTGPARADEIGELAFALPVLMNYRRPLIKSIFDEPGFSFTEYHSRSNSAPSHLELLTHGLVALFDPDPESWIRVAANMALATIPFKDGQTLQSEHFQAPQQAAETVSRNPIAAHTVVHRQIQRIELARAWLGTHGESIALIDDRRASPALWKVYKMTPAAVIRGKDAGFGDLLAGNVIYQISGYFERTIAPEETNFAFLRKQFPAFVRGFDARYEGVVDPLGFASAARGKEMSDGLRRFENGGLYIGAIAETLGELSRTITKLRHACDNPVRFVLDELAANEETPVAARLHDLFRDYHTLSNKLFSENTEHDFSLRTRIRTDTPYDLVRSLMFYLTQAVRPDLESDNDRRTLVAGASTALDRLLDLSLAEAFGNGATRGRGAAAPRHQRGGANAEHAALLGMAALFSDNFETLQQVLRNLVQPLQVARVLAEPQAALERDYLSELNRRRVSGAG